MHYKLSGFRYDTDSEVAGPEVVDALFKLTDATSLSLINGILHIPSNEYFIYFFSKAKGLRALNLDCNDLGNIPKPKLINMFEALKDLTSLDLSNNSINSHFDEEIVEIIFSKVKGLISLNLNGNDLSHIPASTFVNGFAGLQGLTSLSLRSIWGRRLYSCEHLVEIFTQLKGVRVLDFSDNCLGFKSSEDLQRIFLEFKGLTSLGLGNNWLGLKLADVYGDLKRLTSLDLSGNNLIDIPSLKLREIFSAFSALTTLNLSNNRLGRFLGENLASIFTKLDGIRTLDLSWNDLHERTGQELAEMLTSLKRVKSLNLARNGLAMKSANELIAMFAALQGVTTLNLTCNGLEHIPLETMVRLEGSLKNVQTVYLDTFEVYYMKREQRAALRAIFPNAQNIFLSQYKLHEEPRPNLLAEVNLAIWHGLKMSPPSLFSQAAFFAMNKSRIDISKAPIGDFLKDKIQEFGAPYPVISIN